MSRESLTSKDGEREYHIRQGFMGDGRPIVVRLKGIPPCLFCAEPVESPSTDGPLICGWCDCGSNRDGTPWTSEQSRERHQHVGEMVRKYRDAMMGGGR